MSVSSLVWSFLIGPLKLIFEVIFQTANELVNDPGLSIIFLSLAMNLLVLPLYRRSDAIQEEARDAEARLHDGIVHIKKTFSGNERMMMLQTYYRQNQYSPLNVLRGSASLLLEIPFFMAAYQFLSRLEVLKGVSFGPIPDLGAPDQLIAIGAITINALPVIMTLINFISSAIYLRGFPLRTKIQLYAMAVFFLFFLYDSPSGLVFYWTLNNVFSLVKNLVTALFQKRPAESVSGKRAAPVQPRRWNMIAASVFLTILTGVLIPSAFIGASPMEYVDAACFFHPLWYIANSFALAAGTFLLWIGVFYWLSGNKGKVIFERVLWILCGAAAADYLFFGTNLGFISSSLVYQFGMYFSWSEIWWNAGIICILILVFLAISIKWPDISRRVLTAASIAILVMSIVNLVSVKREIGSMYTGASDDVPHFTLSREGRNVVILFLDRAMGQLLPYLVQEKPVLADMYDGFTYYSNVISHGGHTNMGAPPLMGGYEYTPVEMNRRTDLSLMEKHNESMKVMPVLFMDQGYKVTVCDIPYGNYRWFSDLSVYDEYPSINKYLTKGRFDSPEEKQHAIDDRLRNFFCFSLMKASPVFLQPAMYHEGDYHAVRPPEAVSFQTRDGISCSTGMHHEFLESYNVLCHLGDMTQVSEGSEDTFLFLYNDAPHEPMLLQEGEDYKPAAVVNNLEYDEEHWDRFTLDGRSIRVVNGRTPQNNMMHYQSNMACMLRIGEWLDQLRDEGVYDNTRIIIAADHGYYLYLSDELTHTLPGVRDVDGGNYFPLLMMKDFGSHGFTTSDTFMTNADVPSLAMEGLIQDPVNPFTGNPITMDEKTAHDQFIMTTRVGGRWMTTVNNGNQFMPTRWAAVSKDIWNPDNWKFVDEEVVLTEHQLPSDK